MEAETSAYPLTDATGLTVAWHRVPLRVQEPQGSHGWLQALTFVSDIEGFAVGVAVVFVVVLVVVSAVGVVAYNAVAVAAVELTVLLWKRNISYRLVIIVLPSVT